MASRDQSAKALKRLVESTPRRATTAPVGGDTMRGLVLGSTNEATTVLDIASGAIVRWRVPWPRGLDTDLEAFDVVEVELASDIDRTDLAQPEAITVADLPRRLGSYRGRRVRAWLETLASPPDGALFGFRGASAPYWEFRGERPSVALVTADRGPQLLRRVDDGSTWVRFGWLGDDIWLLCEDVHAIRAMETTRTLSLSGKELATALGFRPTYVLVTLSNPVDGHVYKSCTGLLPRG
jgi:hypothetical protein